MLKIIISATNITRFIIWVFVLLIVMSVLHLYSFSVRHYLIVWCSTIWTTVWKLWRLGNTFQAKHMVTWEFSFLLLKFFVQVSQANRTLMSLSRVLLVLDFDFVRYMTHFLKSFMCMLLFSDHNYTFIGIYLWKLLRWIVMRLKLGFFLLKIRMKMFKKIFFFTVFFIVFSFICFVIFVFFLVATSVSWWNGNDNFWVCLLVFFILLFFFVP